MQGVTRQHKRTVVVMDLVEHELVPRTVEAGDGTLSEAEVMPVRERQIVDAVDICIHASRRDFVQQRLPQMRRVLIDQYDLGPTSSSQSVAEARSERQTSGTAADDDHAVQHGLRCGHRA